MSSLSNISATPASVSQNKKSGSLPLELRQPQGDVPPKNNVAGVSQQDAPSQVQAFNHMVIGDEKDVCVQNRGPPLPYKPEKIVLVPSRSLNFLTKVGARVHLPRSILTEPIVPVAPYAPPGSSVGFPSTLPTSYPDSEGKTLSIDRKWELDEKSLERVVEDRYRNYERPGSPIRPEDYDEDAPDYLTHTPQERVRLLEAINGMDRKETEEVVAAINEAHPVSFSDRVREMFQIDEFSIKSLIMKHAQLTNEQWEMVARCAQVFDSFENIAFLIYNLVYSNGAVQVYGTIYMYLSTIFGADRLVEKNAVTALASTAATYIIKALSKKKRRIETQSFSEDFSKFASMFTTILDGALAKAIGGLVVAAASMKIFSYDTASSIYELFGSAKKMSIIELAKSVIDSIASLIKAGELYVTGKMTFLQILLKDNPLAAALVEYDTLMAQKDVTYSGLPIPGKIDRTDWLRRSTATMGTLKAAMDKMGPHLPKRKEIEDKFFNLLKTHDSLISVDSPRPTPCGFVLFGEPAVGKSNLLTFVYTVFSRARGREFLPTHVYSKPQSSDYWDGYRPGEHPIVFLSEMGSDHDNFATKQKDETLALLTSLLDSNPLTLDMSRAEDKGRYSFRSELVAIDTNTEDMNIKKQRNNPSAYFRRLIFLKVIVKPEYRIPGSQAIDPEKCNDGKPWLDRYLFELYTYIPVDKTQMNKDSLMTGAPTDDIYRLYEVLFTYFRNFAQKQEDMLAKRYAPDAFDIYAPVNGPAAVVRPQTQMLNEDDRKEEQTEEDLAEEFRQEEPAEHDLCPSMDERGNSMSRPGQHYCPELDSCQCGIEHDYPPVDPNWRRFLIENWNPHTRIYERGYPALMPPPNDYSVRFDRRTREYWARVQATRWLDPYGEDSDFCGLGFQHYCPHAFERVPIYAVSEIKLESESSTTDSSGSDGPFTRFAGQTFNRNICPEVPMPPLIPRPRPASWRKKVKDNFDFVGFRCIQAYNYIHTQCADAADKVKVEVNKVLKKCEHVPKIAKHTVKESASIAYYEMLSRVSGVVISNTDEPTRFFDFTWTRLATWIGFLVVVLPMGFNPLFAIASPIPFFLMKSAVKTRVFKTEMEDFRKKTSRLARERLSRLKMYLGWEALSFSLPQYITLHKSLIAFSGLLGLVIAGISTYKIVQSYSRKEKEKEEAEVLKQVVDAATKSETQVSTFIAEGKDIDAVIQYETETLAGKSYTRISNQQTKYFNSITHITPVLYTGTAQGLHEVILRGLRRIKIGTCTQYGLLIGKNVMLTNAHMAGKKCTVEVSHVGAYHDKDEQRRLVEIEEKDFELIGNDYVLLSLEGVQGKDLVGHFIDDKPSDVPLPSLIGSDTVYSWFRDEKTEWHTGDVVSNIEGFCSYLWERAIPGMCGWPLIRPMGNGFVIAGLHGAGAKADDGRRIGFTAYISRTRIHQGMASLLAKSGLMVLTSVSPKVGHSFQEPAPKSVFRYERLQGVEYYGRLEGPIMANQKSKLSKSYLARSGLMDQYESILGVPQQTKYLPPMMSATWKDEQYVSPINYGMKKMCQVRGHPSRNVVRRCVSLFTVKLVQDLRKNGVQSLCPNDCQTAINGVVYDDYLRRIDASKSAGFGFPGAKKAHIPIVAETQNGPLREPTVEVLRELKKMLDAYMRDESYGVVYKAALKDEPREESRALSGNTRLFYVSPLAFLIACRMYLAPFYTLMVQFSKIFYTAIGVDMHREAHILWHLIEGFSKNWMEGDYSKYDLVMPFEIKHGSATVICNVLKAFGYNEAALKVVRGLLSDELFPKVVLLQDMFTLPGIQCSGAYATAEKNSLDGVLLFMVAWYSNPKLMEKNFFDYVFLTVYGDDVVAAIKDEVKEDFNNLTYQKFCAEVYRMEYTPASKKGEMKKFVDDPSFLKRVFRHHPVLDRIVAPLSLDSLNKTLRWYLPSKEATLQEQTLGIYSSVLAELYLHPDVDETKWTFLRNFFINVFKVQFGEDYPIASKISTYDRTYFMMATKVDWVGQPETQSRRSLDELSIPIFKPKKSEEKELPYQKTTSKMFGTTHIVNPPPIHSPHYVNDHLMMFQEELKKAEDLLACATHPCVGLLYDDARRTSAYMCNSNYAQSVDEYFALESAVDGLRVTVQSLQRNKSRRMRIDHQMHREFDFLDFAPEETNKMRRLTTNLTKKAFPGKFKNSFIDHLENIDSFALSIKKRIKMSRYYEHLLYDDKVALSLMAGWLATEATIVKMEMNEFTAEDGYWKQLSEDDTKTMLDVQMRIANFDNLSFVFWTSMKVPEEPDDASMMMKPPEYNCKIQTQSAGLSDMTDGTPPSETKEVLTTDMGNAAIEQVTNLEDPYEVLRGPTTRLPEWFERWFSLTSQQVALNADSNIILDVWANYFLNDTVKAKLRNVAFVKPGKLKVRIIVTGMKFHSGKLLVAYAPFAKLNKVATFYRTNIGTSYRPNALKWMSQLRAHYIDVKSNEPVDVTIGYINFQPLTKLFNYSASAIGAGAAFNDFANIGTLYIISLNQPNATVGNPTQPYLEAFIRMEGMELGPATGTQVAIQTNCHIETQSHDERKSGPIERGATRVANILRPIMKFSPFVTAAQLAASGLASAAAALGWSSPILTNPATRMYVDNFPGGANVERGEMGQMLTLFRSQTLALDVPCGTDFDETNIEWMAGIESLLDTFTWHYNHTPFTIEWTSIIHPQAVVPIIGATNWIIQPTAAGYATAPFAYWRAKKAYFKFQVVCNGLTSGKFAILVDPNVAQYTIITSNIDLNKQHSVLVDLQETQEVTVCIDLLGMNTRPWLNNVDYPTKVQGVGTIVSPTSWIDAAAGFVMFVPITEIQSPDSIDLQVNVFTWFEGMQVNFLTSQYLPATRVMTQMHQSGPEDVKTPCVQLNETTPDPRGLCEHYFGEQPITFGSLLKRYVTTYYNSITPLITDTWIRATLPIYPPIKPLFNSGTADARTYDLLSYLRYAYVGMRGGMTKRLSLVGDYVVRQTRVTLSAPATSTAATSLTSGNNSAPISVLEGTAVFDSGSGGSTIVGIPFYSNNLFLLSGNDTPYDTSDTNQSNYCSRNYTVDFQIDPRTTNARFLTEDTIPSEDFRLCYFLAAVPYAHVKV